MQKTLTKLAEERGTSLENLVDALQAEGISINKYADPIQDEVIGCDDSLVREVLAADPSLLWVEGV